MNKYILCDSCHSPYDLKNNRCLVCDHTYDLKLIKKEEKKQANIKKIEALNSFYNKWSDIFDRVYKYSIVAAIALTAIASILAINKTIVTQDYFLLNRIVSLFERAWFGLSYGFLQNILPDLIKFAEILLVRTMIILPFIWAVLSGAIVNIWSQIDITIELFMKRLS